MLRFRLAPTPSGYLHAGNAYSFLFTDRLARRFDGRVLLRIDDLDAERKRAEYVADIFDSLRWLGIDWAEGPRDAADFEENWSQRHRMHRYDALLARLRAGGHLFACDCSRTRLQHTGAGGVYPGFCLEKNLPLDAPDVAWRIRVPEAQTVAYIDEILGPQTSALGLDLGCFVVRRRDGLPAYQIASLADDLHFGVNAIVRGEDLLGSTAAQLFLAEILGEKSFCENKFWHHPLLRDAEGHKLSKSDGADALRAMRLAGNTADALPFAPVFFEKG